MRSIAALDKRRVASTCSPKRVIRICRTSTFPWASITMSRVELVPQVHGGYWSRTIWHIYNLRA